MEFSKRLLVEKLDWLGLVDDRAVCVVFCVAVCVLHEIGQMSCMCVCVYVYVYVQVYVHVYVYVYVYIYIYIQIITTFYIINGNA